MIPATDAAALVVGTAADLAGAADRLILDPVDVAGLVVVAAPVEVPVPAPVDVAVAVDVAVLAPVGEALGLAADGSGVVAATVGDAWPAVGAVG